MAKANNTAHPNGMRVKNKHTRKRNRFIPLSELEINEFCLALEIFHHKPYPQGVGQPSSCRYWETRGSPQIPGGRDARHPFHEQHQGNPRRSCFAQFVNRSWPISKVGNEVKSVIDAFCSKKDPSQRHDGKRPCHACEFSHGGKPPSISDFPSVFSVAIQKQQR